MFRHNASDFTDGQIKTIWTFLDRQVEKHLKLDEWKQPYWMMTTRTLLHVGQNREYPKGDTFACYNKLQRHVIAQSKM